jgi:hypothetical protein
LIGDYSELPGLEYTSLAVPRGTVGLGGLATVRDFAQGASTGRHFLCYNALNQPNSAPQMSDKTAFFLGRL